MKGTDTHVGLSWDSSIYNHAQEPIDGEPLQKISIHVQMFIHCALGVGYHICFTNILLVPRQSVSNVASRMTSRCIVWPSHTLIYWFDACVPYVDVYGRKHHQSVLFIARTQTQSTDKEIVDDIRGVC